ncbi:Predicted arabinose efflux permease, MFS family [Marinitoga hydrogenitolerans DSM 16785]|uniref:Predicted arabinose efflux permease, MFS family n=1 Tax=Marinitoga hydrogenitolerans (strain DSM 16785 / JCM 12826 / AT1271) TaxID=1122195 RepID=A0A1M4VFH4_MARH1|nr:MFS transporter [Marinitoga hydrogenitolerans]SHE67719.1 Predicted arabinose efflux permease, MFS family [Marinitoga hydrogenitolerans DSM 16785]
MNKIQKRNFLLYVVGRMVSLVGSGIQMVAMPLFILDLTGSGTKMGLFAMISMIPALIIAPFAGVLGDRYNRKNIMVSMDYVRGIIILFLAYMTYIGKINLIVLFITQVLISILDSFFGAATSAMLPDLVSKSDLMKANSVTESISSASMIMGPVLGGVIYGLFGMQWVFILNGISFILSAFSEMFIKYRKTSTLTAEINAKIIFNDIKESISYIFNNYVLKNLILMAIFLNLLFNPMFAVLFPYTFREVIGFSPQQYGLLEMMWTLGILVGNILLAVFFSKRESKKLFRNGIYGMVFLNLLIAVVLIPQILSKFNGIWSIFFVVGALLMLMGITNAFVNTPISVYFQRIIPNENRSKIFSALGVIFQAATPLGMLVIGILVDRVEVHWIFLAISLLIILDVIVFSKKIEQMDFTPSLETE